MTSFSTRLSNVCTSYGLTLNKRLTRVKQLKKVKPIRPPEKGSKGQTLSMSLEPRFLATATCDLTSYPISSNCIYPAQLETILHNPLLSSRLMPHVAIAGFEYLFHPSYPRILLVGLSVSSFEINCTLFGRMAWSR